MSCPPRDELKLASIGALDEEVTERIERHLETCAECLRAAERFDDSDALVEMVRSAPQAHDGLAPHVAASLELIERFQRLSPAALDPTTAPPDTDAGEPCSGPEAVGGDTEVDDVERYDFLAPPQSAGELGRLGGYRVLRLIGTGGMGVVFEAEDSQLKRRVALKAMKPALAASASSRKRFVREAQTAASVEHDHIVHIYQVGEDRGIPFIAMPLLRGETLGERLQGAKAEGGGKAEGRRQKAEDKDDVRSSGGNGPHPSLLPEAEGTKAPGALPVDEVLRIGREVAEGLDAAHQAGLIHRDVKPGNIWLEAGSGRVKILDFGLARAVTFDDHLTQSGMMLGTPSYMAPEQARGEAVDARADLFSLGCVLYQMATGVRPFLGRDPLSTVLAVTTQHPPRPREIDPALPVELDDLVVSLLSKEPAGRPVSARVVTETLETIAVAPPSSTVSPADAAIVEDGLPSSRIKSDRLESPSTVDGLGRPSSEKPAVSAAVGSAHPPKPPRRRGLATLAAAAAAAAMLLGVVIVIKNRKGEVVATVETQDRPDVKVSSEYTAEVAPPSVAPTLRGGDGVAKGNRLAPPSRSAGSTLPAVAADESGNDVPHSKALSPLALVTEPAVIEGVKSWTIETTGHRGGIYEAEYSPDGKWLATLGYDGTIRLWDPITGKLVRIILARGQAHALAMLNLPHVAGGISGLEQDRAALAWSPDSAALALVDFDAIRICEADTGRCAKTMPIDPPDRIYTAAWSPDGKTLAIAVRRTTAGQFTHLLELVDAETGELLDSSSAGWKEPEGVNGGVPTQPLCWSPDSRRLAFNSTIWNIETGKQQATAGKGGAVFAWRADGALLTAVRVITGNMMKMELWRADTGELVCTLPGDVGTYGDAYPRFNADGSRVVMGTAGGDGGTEPSRVFVWETVSGELVKIIELGAFGEWFVPHTIGPLGKSVASFGPSAGKLRIINPSSGDIVAHRPLIGALAPYLVAAWSPDGTTLAARSADNQVCSWDLATCRPRALSTPPTWVIESLAWRQDRPIVRAWNGMQSTLYDGETGQFLRSSGVGSGAGFSVSANGEFAALAEATQVAVYATDPVNLLKKFDAQSKFPPILSRDGTRLATIAEKTTIWDVASGKQLATLDIAAPAEWSPDGKRLAYTFGSGERFEIRDAMSGERVAELTSARDGLGRPSSEEPVVADGARLAWSPDGTRIAGFGRAWNSGSGETVCFLERFGRQQNTGQPVWSPDGAYVAYCAPDLALSVADAATGRVVATLLSLTRGRTLAISPRGHFRASPRFADELVYVVETDAGQETLSPAEFAEKYGWENDPGQVGIGGKAEVKRQKAETKAPDSEDGNPKSKIQNLKSLGSLAMVQHPAALPGVEGWSLEPAAPVGWTCLHQLNALALSPDGKWLAVGGDDGHVRIFDWASGNAPRLAKLLIGHTSAVVAVAWSSDGKRMASAEFDRPVVRLWDVDSARLICSTSVGLNTVTCLSWSPDDGIVAVNGIGGPRLIEAETGQPLPLLEQRLNTDTSLAWSKDGNRLAAGGDGGVQIWEVATGNVRHALKCDRDGMGNYVAWSPDEKSLCSANGAGVFIWNPDNGELQIKLPVPHTLHTAAAAPVWLGDSTMIFFTGIDPQVWDVIKGERRDKQQTYQPRRTQSADGRIVATGGLCEGPILIYDMRSKKRRQIALNPLTCSAALSPGHGKLVAASAAGPMNVWHNGPQGRLDHLPPRVTAALTAWIDEETLFAQDASSASICSYAGQWQDRDLPIEPPTFWAAEAVSHDGRRVACATNANEGKTIGIWDIASGKHVVDLEPRDKPVRCVAWQPDGSKLAAAGHLGVNVHSVSVWDTQTGRQMGEPKELPSDVVALSWSPGGMLAVACQDGVVRICDAHLTVRYDLPGHIGRTAVAAVAWSGDGNEVITADASTIRRWAADSGKLLKSVRHAVPCQVLDHPQPCFFSRDNRLLLIPRAGVRVIDTTTGELLATMRPLRGGQCAVVSPDGHYLGTKLAEKELVYVVQTADGQELLSPKEFAAKYGWKNDPGMVKLP
jgi:WD40 repeat protein/serine/threonine protein kinase